MELSWYELRQVKQALTPQILFYPGRITENIQEMIRVAGTPERLRPHVKTFKCKEILSMQLDGGIRKFKCATVSEALLLAELEVPDVLIAYPLIGPAQGQFLGLKARFPNTRFSVLIDNEKQLTSWNAHGQAIDVFIDVNVGMNRTGISPENAALLYEEVQISMHHFRGWHCYDGHIHSVDVAERQRQVEAAFSPVERLIKATNTKAFEHVCGGSITFPLHAQYAQRTLSPGTIFLWDQGYSAHFPDLKFFIAATLITRVISKPGPGLVCLDSGHKAVGSEMKTPPLYFPQIPDAEIRIHSEEHLVLRTSMAEELALGQLLYGFPYHICPTVALHESVGVIEDHQLKDRWEISARKRLYQ